MQFNIASTASGRDDFHLDSVRCLCLALFQLFTSCWEVLDSWHIDVRIPPHWVRLVPNGTNMGRVKICFWNILGRTDKCTKIWPIKSHLGPIWPSLPKYDPRVYLLCLAYLVAAHQWQTPCITIISPQHPATNHYLTAVCLARGYRLASFTLK